MTDVATESFSNWKQLQPVFEGQTGFGPRKNEKNIAAEEITLGRQDLKIQDIVKK